MELRDVPHVNEPDYDPLWSACEELGVPLCIHAGSASDIRMPAPPSLSPAVAAAYGWNDWTPQMADDEILRRLLALNLQRTTNQ